MRNRGTTRGGGVSRGGGRGQYNPRGHHWRPGHPYQRHSHPPRPYHNACNPRDPQLSPGHFRPHGPRTPRPRHPAARPEGQNRWQHAPPPPPPPPPPPGTPVPHRPPPPGTQRLPSPGQFGAPPRGPPPPPRTWLTTSQPPVNVPPNQPPGPFPNTGNQQQYSSEYPQYNSTACDYMGSDPGRGHGGGDDWGGGGSGEGGGWGRGRGRGHGGHFEQGRKKQRKDPTPNKNKSFYCETCDRGYQGYEKYREHCDQHIECPHEGCSYKASPKLIDNHDFQQHKTGLFKLIWNKTSKEDISKWIADRKRNFPSATNIQRKKEELARRVARGEVLQTKDFGKMGRVGGHAKNRAQKVRDFYKNKRNKGRENNDGETMATTHRRGTVRRGQRSQRARMEKSAKKLEKRALASGVDLKLSKSDVLAYDVSASDEDESGDEKKSKGNVSLVEEINAMAKKLKKEASQPKPQKPQCAGALGSLVSAYGSDDSDSSAEEGEIKDDEPIKSEPLRLPEVDRPEVKPPEVKPGASPSQKFKPGSRRQPGRKPTLLQMLLAPDIRHERNVLLQCVRYVINKNFFGVGAQRSNSASTQRSKSNNTDTTNGDLNKNDVIVANNNSLEKPPCRTNYDEDEIWDDVKEDFS